MLGTAVPEAAVDEDGNPPTRQDEVRSAALGDLAMEPKPATSRVDGSSQHDLGGRVDLGAAGEMASLRGAYPVLDHLPKLTRSRPGVGEMPDSGEDGALGVPVALDS